jgi:hypothetical protein
MPLSCALAPLRSGCCTPEHDTVPRTFGAYQFYACYGPFSKIAASPRLSQANPPAAQKAPWLSHLLTPLQYLSIRIMNRPLSWSSTEWGTSFSSLLGQLLKPLPASHIYSNCEIIRAFGMHSRHVTTLSVQLPTERAINSASPLHLAMLRSVEWAPRNLFCAVIGKG